MTEPEWTPDLAPGDPERFRDSPDLARGVELFNAAEYYEAHEAWETAWMPHRHEVGSDFFKGLVQVAAGCLHYSRHNREGALIKWRSGADYLRAYAPAAHGVLVQQLVDHVDGIREALESVEWARLRMPQVAVD